MQSCQVLDVSQKRQRFRKFIAKQIKQVERHEIEPDDVSNETSLKFPKRQQQQTKSDESDHGQQRQVLLEARSPVPTSNPTLDLSLASLTTDEEESLLNSLMTTETETMATETVTTTSAAPATVTSEDIVDCEHYKDNAGLPYYKHDVCGNNDESCIDYPTAESHFQKTATTASTDTTEEPSAMESTSTSIFDCEHHLKENPGSPYYKEDVCENDGESGVEYPTNDSRFHKRMYKYIRHLNSTWRVAVEIAEKQDPDDWMLSLVWFFLGESMAMSLPDLKRYLIRLANMFRAFAVQQPEFAKLSVGDKRRLLCQNAPMFIQFCMGRFFLADNAKEQIQWLTQIQEPDDTLGNMSLDRMTLETFEKTFCLFTNESFNCKYEYEDRLEVLKSNKVPFHFCSLVALMCVFHGGENHACLLDSESYVCNQDHDNGIVLEWCHEVYGTPAKTDILIAIQACCRMATIFEAHIDWEGKAGRQMSSLNDIMKRELCLKFSNQEDNWFNEQMDNFSKIFHSIQFSERDLIGFAAFSKTGEISFDLLKSILSTGVERIKRIFFSQVGSFPSSVQAENWQQVLPLAQAMWVMQCESAPDPLSQFCFGCSGRDRAKFLSTVEQMYGRDEAKLTFTRKISVAAIPGSSKSRTLTRLFGLCDEVGSITWADMDAFRLLTLMSIASGPNTTALFKSYERHWGRLIEERQKDLPASLSASQALSHMKDISVIVTAIQSRPPPSRPPPSN